MRQAVAGKDRQLLAAHQRVHAVDGGHTGLNEFTRITPGKRIDRLAIHIAPVGGQRGRTAIGRPAESIKNAAQHLPRNRQAKTFAEKTDAQSLIGQPGGSFQNLHHRLGFRNVEDAPEARSSAGINNFHRLVKADIADAIDHDQRPFNARRAEILQPAIFDVESEVVHVSGLDWEPRNTQRVWAADKTERDL